MGNISEFFIRLIEGLFDRYGYVIVFLGPFLENTLLLGLFVPGVIVLLLAGFSAQEGAIDLRPALLIAIAGTSLGDTISYLAGRFGWRRALARAEELPFMGTVRGALMRRTGIFVLAYHFLGYTRVVGPITAGAVRVPFRRWWLLDALGATIWVSVYMIAGYALGGVIGYDTLKGHAKQLDRILLVLGVVTVVVILAIRRRRGHRALVPATDATEAVPEEPTHSGLP